MLKQLRTWEFIETALQARRDVVLLYVLESKGSSPGRSGFFMAVDDHYAMSGSIGGGMMEHKLVELAKNLLKNEEQGQLLKRQIHDKTAPKHRSGMICSGEQIVSLHKINPATEAPVIRAILQTLYSHTNAFLQLSHLGLAFRPYFSTDNNGPIYRFEQKNETEWQYEEKIGYTNKLFIIGGGHCALAFSQLMSNMNFYIAIYEDRPELNTFLQNNFAHQKTIVDNYAQLADLIPSGNQHYVVIMTFGYRTDDIALRALLGKHFKYLGLLGSRAKIKQLFDELQKDGILQTIIEQIHAPAGIALKSQTPEEIAISIAAEIIALKNNTPTGT